MLILCAADMFCAVGLLCAVTTYAQKMHMCADNAPSACIMRECVFCADYAQMRIVRSCALCAAAHYAAAAQNAQRQSQSRESQKRIIFRRILEQEGETSKNQ